MSRRDYDYKRFSIKAARELRYSKRAIERLENATNEHEIKRIMCLARKGEI